MVRGREIGTANIFDLYISAVGSKNKKLAVLP